MGVDGKHHSPAALAPGKGPSTQFAGGWVDPGPVWTDAENSPPSGFDPRTVQPVASRYKLN
jgi:hypothetical protein